MQTFSRKILKFDFFAIVFLHFDKNTSFFLFFHYFHLRFSFCKNKNHTFADL